MANVSDATGTMIFQHPMEPPTFINEIIKFTEEFYYGELMVSEEEDFMWGEEVGFASFGRWTMQNTLENFFESFNEEGDPASLERMDKLTIEFKFTDYEPGVEYFADLHIITQAQYDRQSQKLSSKIIKETTNDIEVSAKTLVDNEHVEWAADTYTEYGIEALREDIVDVLDLNIQVRERYTELHPKMEALLKNFDSISTDEWLQIFKDQESDNILYDVAEEPYYYEMMFVDSDIFNHPIVQNKI